MARNLIIASGICVVAGIVLAAFDFHEQSGRNLFATSLPVESEYRWTKVTDNAAFSKSYNFQLFNHHDTLWAFHTNGNYFSTDGKSWVKSTLDNSIYNLAFLDYVQFNNSILGLGHFEGNIERFSLTTSVTKTTDLKTWRILSKQSNLPCRFFYHPFVFNNKIWIVGGTDGKEIFSDIWNSADGVTWTKVVNETPFKGKENQQFVFFRSKIFMLDDEVWTSEDAIHWTKRSDRIIDAPLFGYAAIVYDNKIWLLGCNRNGLFTSEILVSEDGIGWKKMDAPWSPRGGIAATVYNGKIYMTGGKYGGTPDHTEFVYSNDVWAMEKVD